MNILVIGSGGREHALVWKLRQSPHASRIFCAPGNGGIGEIAEIVPLKITDIEGLAKFAQTASIDLTVVGPEQPLIDGIVDAFEARGLRIFGPRKSAAVLEGSKLFSKQFMKKYKIPTADFSAFDQSEYTQARQYLLNVPYPVVVKADGLAAGKGVSICETKEQALQALDAMMSQKVFGEAGSKVVVEECLTGEEASFLALTDGKESIMLAPAQDHKRIFDNDQGRNTGGMGAYAPAPLANEEMIEKIKRTVIRPTLRGMAKENRPYKGCLYAGIMMTEDGPKVLEYNCRFGDPETQVVLPLLETDLVEIMMEISSGKLTTTKVVWKQQNAVCVVIASGGYPDAYESGKKIFGLDAAASDPDVVVFHAGTKREKKGMVTAGGRVLNVTAIGPGNNLEETIERAYLAVGKITFDGAYYRSDIGKKGVQRLKQQQQTGVA
ncbi:MAG: phosphoribosylamine--glycine ligase [Bacteroidota bacterium]|jgi:phosphoribosylamine--glycine ligase